MAALSEDILAMTFHDNSPSLSIDGMLMDSVTIASVLREAHRRPHVKELVLRNVAVDDTVAKAVQSLFSSSYSTTTMKTRSTKTNANKNNNYKKRMWTKMESIHCTGHISRMVQAILPSVQQFSFTGSVPIAHNPRYSLDASSLEALGLALRECKALTTLSLKGTRLSLPGLQAFCTGLAKSESLETLQMSHCALDSNHVSLLASALGKNQHLTALSLAHCKFGTHPRGAAPTSNPAAQFATLLESLIAHPKLQSLNIYGIYCIAQATQALADLLRAPHSQLWHLGMKNNLLHPEDKLPVTVLLQALEHNKQLTYLQLSGNNVDDADMEQLSQIITRSNHTLRALSLTANNIGDQGILSFARGLHDMKALRYLDVQRNRFTAQSKPKIVAALKDNMELERLDLDGTWDASKSFYLSLNKGGRRLLQSANTTPLGLWPLVLERANLLQFGRNQPHANLNVLYCLVQGPALFQPTRKRSIIDPPHEEDAENEPKNKRARLND